jgi:hypothetical protein
MTQLEDYRNLFVTLARREWNREEAFDAIDRFIAATEWKNRVFFDQMGKGTHRENSSEFFAVLELLRIGAMVYRAFSAYQAERKRIPKGIMIPLAARHFADLRVADLTLESACRIARRLDEQGAANAVFKGTWNRQELYSGAPVRTHDDLDLLVKREDLPKAAQALEAEGYVAGEYNAEKQQIRRIDAEEKRRLDATCHPTTYIKLAGEKETLGGQMVLACEPHTQLSAWPGDLVRRLPCIPREALLEGTRTLETPYGRIHGLSRPLCVLAMCLSIYKDALSVLAIARCTDLRLLKLCDLREYVIASSDEFLADLWRRAAQWQMVEAVELCAKHLSLIYEEDRLWNARPAGYREICDIDIQTTDGVTTDPGFSPALDGRWVEPLRERYFEPWRNFRLVVKALALRSGKAL